MLRQILIFAICLISCGISGTTAQTCIPEQVLSVTLDNTTLNWSSSSNCPDTQYIIIILSAGVIEYEYNIDTLSLDVSFLRLCRNYDFSVTPVADHILGLTTTLESAIILPDDTDIVVQNFTANQIADDILVQWLVDEDHSSCIGYFHVLIWNEDTDPDTPDSLYIGQNGFLVEHVAQCMNYQFEITAHYSNRNGSTQQFNFTVPEKPNVPFLVELRQNTVAINTTWGLEKYHVNRCNITALYVNGTQFNQTYEIVDSPDRPDVLVSITNLTADTMYYFNVSTDNSGGISQAFQIAVQTLHIDPTEVD